MRKIDEIIWHCTATPEGRNVTVNEINTWHKARGWSGIGYHFVVYLDGSVHIGRPIDRVGAHVENHNTGTIGCVYVGGTDKNGKAKDTRTAAQKEAMIKLTQDLIKKYPIKKISGHYEYANKACPCFNANNEYSKLLTKSVAPQIPNPVISNSKLAQEVQTMLKKLNYDVGMIDGIIGRRTLGAIVKFQADHGMKVTDTINYEVINKLREVTAAKKEIPVKTMIATAGVLAGIFGYNINPIIGLLT